MPRLLIVDDALADRTLVAGLVGKWMDSDIIEAKDGKEALEMIASHAPDLVLTDLHMPEMNGLELVTAVREDYPFIPVILMTAQGSEEIAAEALRQGAASYVPKRRLAYDLQATLHQVLGTARGEQTRAHLLHHMTATDTTFVVHNDLSLIRTLVDHLLGLLRCLPLGDETERLRVGIAMQEALENAYYHGNLEIGTADEEQFDGEGDIANMRAIEEPYCHRRIKVHARIDRNEARLTITDDGNGFDHAKHLNGDFDDDDDDIRKRGLVLMRSIMDEVNYNDAGNEVTLVKQKFQ